MYLPLITPTLIAVGTYAFFFAWNEYLYAVLLLQGEKMITLPVGMGNFLTSDDAPWNLLMALSVIYSIPPVVFYYIFRRYLTHGLVSGAVQGT
jgi:multiple sugar transport system permease protein